MVNYSILTFIFNGYEKLHEVVDKSPFAEYICVTDDSEMKSDTWTVVYDGDLIGYGRFEKCWQVRYHPFKYCHTDMVILVDASIALLSPLDFLIDKMEKDGYERCLMLHPRCSRIDREYAEWEMKRNYPHRDSLAAMKIMSDSGYDFSYRGLYQLCFQVVRKCDANLELNRSVHSILQGLGHDGDSERLDQTIFSYVANSRFSNLRVLPVSEFLIHSKYIRWCFHGCDKEIKAPLKFWRWALPYLFNKLVIPFR